MSADDLEPRVRAQERMTLQEGLRASQDRDLAAVELRTRQIATGVERIEQQVTTTNGLLEQFALDTIVRFRQVDVRFEQVESRFERIDARFEQVESRFERIDARFEQVESRLDGLASGQIHHGRLLAELVAKVDRLAG